jgi:hypothetical protein
MSAPIRNGYWLPVPEWVAVIRVNGTHLYLGFSVRPYDVWEGVEWTMRKSQTNVMSCELGLGGLFVKLDHE